MTRAPAKSPFHWQNIAAWVLIVALVGYGLYAQYQEQRAPDAPATPAKQVAESKSETTPEPPPQTEPAKSVAPVEKSPPETPATKPAPRREPSSPKSADSGGFSKPTPPAAGAKTSAEKSSTKSSSTSSGASPKNSSPSKDVASGKTKPIDTRPAPGSSTPRRGVFQNVTIRDREGEVIFKGEIDLGKSLERIAKDQVISRFPNDGTVFQNREGRLPKQPPGYYREWVHPTPGEGGPGPQRIVTGEEGDIWYTHDHYKTFRRVPP